MSRTDELILVDAEQVAGDDESTAQHHLRGHRLTLDEHDEQHREGERHGARDLVEWNADALQAQVVDDEHADVGPREEHDLAPQHQAAGEEWRGVGGTSPALRKLHDEADEHRGAALNPRDEDRQVGGHHLVAEQVLVEEHHRDADGPIKRDNTGDLGRRSARG